LVRFDVGIIYPIFTDTVDVGEFRVQPFFGGTAAPWNLAAGYTYSENVTASLGRIPDQ